MSIVSKRMDRFRNFMSESMSKQQVEELLDWLNKKVFFSKPASIKHHGNYSGGLFDHSLAVAQKLVELTNNLDLVWERPESPYIVGMLHDVCKTDDYIQGDVYEWAYNNQPVMQGHGDKSVIMLSTALKLTEEEMLCIRYHMGAFKTEDWTGYSKAVNKYENVLWTHTADMCASQVKNV